MSICIEVHRKLHSTPALGNWRRQARRPRGWFEESAVRIRMASRWLARSQGFSKKTAELAEEAAAAPPVAGRLPQNHELAGKQFPAERLPATYRQQGLRFTEAGYPASVK